MPIADVLASRLREAFSPRRLRSGFPPDPVATFPAVCPEVGSLSIYDDGEEATVLIENVTHHHVNPYNRNMSPDEAAHWIAQNVVDFLDELFADRVLLWSIDRGKKGGGWRTPFEGEIPSDVLSEADVFVWSRRIRHASGEARGQAG